MRQRLLPRYFKWIGLLVIVFPVIAGIFIKFILKIEISSNKEQWSQVASSIVLLGFLLVILAREKHEDEFVDSCRLTAFRAAFIIGIVQFILAPVFNFSEGMTPRGILLGEMFFYLLLFHGLKRGIIQYG